MAYKSLSTANLPDPAIDPAQDKEPRDYFETFLYTGNGAGLQVGDVIKKPADTITISSSVILDGSNEYFSRTVQSGGSTSEWTISFWFKDVGGILGGDTIIGNTDSVIFYFNSSDSYRLTFFMGNSSSQWALDRILKDDGMWHHVVVNYDSARSSSEYLKVWVDGVAQTFSRNDGAVNAHITGDGTLSLGARGDGSQSYKGYLAEIHMCDGNAYDATEFGTFDANGIWIPQTPSVTYGTTGFHVNFSDNTSTTTLGEDQAGSNDFTYNNGETTDQVSDSPTDNFATLDFNNKNSVVTLSEGNLSFTASNNRFVTSTTAVNSGKWYLEFSPTAGGGSGVGVGVILATTDVSGGAGFANSGTYTGVGYTTNGNKYISSVGSAYGDGYGAGNVIGVALDLDSSPQTITFYKDDANQGSINLPASNQTWRFATDFSHAGTHSINFGQRSFSETQPTSYLALSENNITVDDQNLESPDFVWIKNRSAADYHQLYDSVRGVQKELRTNTTTASLDAPNGLLDFNTNGFTLGSQNEVNTSGEDYVAWCWKAGGTASTIAVDTYSAGSPSVASTVSANTESGFSIVDLTDPDTGASYEVGHGLNSPPEMFFIKKTNTTSDWSVYHKDVGNDRRLVLNDTGGQSASSSVYFGSTTPTSDVVTIGSGLSTGDDWIMYCFHSVEGYSKIGSYTGATNGAFVYLGFRPAFVMIKNTGSSSWWMMDSKRDTYNVMDDYLIADNTTVGTYTSLDFLSNGFRTRNTSSSFNTNGATHIYMAFAENPFKYSLAR